MFPVCMLCLANQLLDCTEQETCITSQKTNFIDEKNFRLTLNSFRYVCISRCFFILTSSIIAFMLSTSFWCTSLSSCSCWASASRSSCIVVSLACCSDAPFWSSFLVLSSSANRWAWWEWAEVMCLRAAWSSSCLSWSLWKRRAWLSARSSRLWFSSLSLVWMADWRRVSSSRAAEASLT